MPGRAVSDSEATTTTCLCFGHRQRTLAVMAVDLVIPDLVIGYRLVLRQTARKVRGGHFYAGDLNKGDNYV